MPRPWPLRCDIFAGQRTVRGTPPPRRAPHRRAGPSLGRRSRRWGRIPAHHTGVIGVDNRERARDSNGQARPHELLGVCGGHHGVLPAVDEVQGWSAEPRPQPCHRQGAVQRRRLPGSGREPDHGRDLVGRDGSSASERTAVPPSDQPTSTSGREGLPPVRAIPWSSEARSTAAPPSADPASQSGVTTVWPSSWRAVARRARTCPSLGPRPCQSSTTAVGAGCRSTSGA